MAGEHLAQVPLQERGAVEPLVDAVDQLAQDHGSLQKLGPTGAVKSPLARRTPSAADLDRELGERLGRRAVDGRRAVEHVEGGLVARAAQLVLRGEVEPERAPGVRADLGVRHQPVRGSRHALSDESCSSPGPTLISTAWESAEPAKPSGKTVVIRIGLEGVAPHELAVGRDEPRPGRPLGRGERVPGRPPERADREERGQAERRGGGEQEPRQERAAADLLDAGLHRVRRARELRLRGHVVARLGLVLQPGHQLLRPEGEPGPDAPQRDRQQRALGLRLSALRVDGEQAERREDREGEADRDQPLGPARGGGVAHGFDPVSRITRIMKPSPTTAATRPSATAPTRPSCSPPSFPLSRTHSR